MLFTVCTPTFNRAHTLSRVFESLKAQTITDFEWLIIDDGSIDHTRAVIKEFANIAAFRVRYEYQKNQGKHVAVNHGARIADGLYFLIADSDDSFPPDALQELSDAFHSISETDRLDFTGVTGLCADDDGNIVGDLFPCDVFDSTPMEVSYRHRVTGEKWGFHRTEVIRKFPFPEPKGLKFLPEGVIWSAIGHQYKTRYINKVVRTYKQDAGEQLTGRSPHGISPARIAYAMLLNIDHDYMSVSPVKFVALAVQGVRYSCHQSDSLREQFDRLERFKIKCLWAVAIIPGWLLYRYDLVREK